MGVRYLLYNRADQSFARNRKKKNLSYVQRTGLEQHGGNTTPDTYSCHSIDKVCRRVSLPSRSIILEVL